MNYLVIVSDINKVIIEKITFSYRDEALYYLECRRKQGYVVTLNQLIISKGENNGSNQEVSRNNGR